MNRDLDAEIVERIFKWRYIQVGKDANGQNACEILFTPEREPTQEDYNYLPLKGKIHKGINAPNYCGDLKTAIVLAKHVNLPMELKDMPLDAEKLAKRSLEYWTSLNGV